MTIQDLLRKELIGKSIGVYVSEFRYNKNSEPEFRYYTSIGDAKLIAKNDKRLKYIGESFIKIKDVECHSDSYEGDSIHLLLEVDGYNGLSITTVEDLKIQ